MRYVTAARRRWVTAVSAAAVAVSLFAFTVLGFADPAAVAPIQELCDSLLASMRAGSAKAPFAQRYDALARSVDGALDLATILQVSVGPIWNTLSPDEHAALMTAFRRYTVNSYLNSFDTFSGQKFVVSPDTRPSGTNQIVLTRIVPASGEGHEIDYVMRQSSTGWLAVDVLSDGTISRVATQRSDFRALVMRGGAPALLATLQRKADDLAESH